VTRAVPDGPGRVAISSEDRTPPRRDGDVEWGARSRGKAGLDPPRFPSGVVTGINAPLGRR